MNRFAFDANRHEYIDTDHGEVLPHITSMLEETGWTDHRWCPEEALVRGQKVHRLTTDYDLGAIEQVALVTTKYKPWLLAHVKGMELVRPTWRGIEEALIHAHYRYGGRPDRWGEVYGAVSVVDIKSGPPEKGHPIQTALQAILAAQETGLPAETIRRYCWYITGKGKFKLQEHVSRRDFDEAYAIIDQCCQVAA